MDVKEAVRVAREYITDLYSDEEIANVGLEEVDFDPDAGIWRITIGFSRPWNRPEKFLSVVDAVRSRSYKTVCIHDLSEEIGAVTDRFLVPTN